MAIFLSPIIGVVGKVIDSLLQSKQMTEQDAQAARTALAQAAVQADQTFSAFIQATSPSPTTWIGSWTNAIYTVVRNGGVVAIMVSFFQPAMQETMLKTINGYANGGLAGLLILSVVLWEYYGREALTMVTGLKGNGNGGSNGGGDPAAANPPAPLPAPAKPASVLGGAADALRRQHPELFSGGDRN